MTTEPTPSQAEGEREGYDATDEPTDPQTTPSQAEGERDDDAEVTPPADTGG
ncbi:hypothetical protein ACFWII_34480 [Streptomyces sp. NPDC127063]|uniref:hypothetical protein n=1 Tax=Streptomyces sp. NPDC127063 TaxID=3347123 RepID=UPI00364807DF